MRKPNTPMDPAIEAYIVRQRLGDYTAQDAREAREHLTAAWRAAHPEAANEPPSAGHRELVLISRRGPGEPPEDPDETWTSDLYNVTLRRKPDHVFGSDGGMIQLGINAIDGTARHDWREFQWIKNQLAGEECEAFELYPAESRLMDPSNYYTLWCFPGVRQIKVGMRDTRRVYDAEESYAPQRGLPK
jgi:hypothetical protein